MITIIPHVWRGATAFMTCTKHNLLEKEWPILYNAFSLEKINNRKIKQADKPQYQ